MAKTVATYSWLMRKAMVLHKKDHAEYLKLMGGGTDKLIRGATIQLRGHQHYDNKFTIGVNGKQWCEIYGINCRGKFYSLYQPCFTSSQYRKRLVEKYMPFSLPDGVRSKHNSLGSRTQCIYHNADGSVAGEGFWDGGRRNRKGQPDRPLRICDDTGEFAMQPLAGADYEQYESLMYLGWFDEASRNRKDWLESVRQMPYCDTSKVLDVSAKAYLAAARLCERYPNMRMAMFPAGIYQYGHDIRSQWYQHCGKTAVLHRDSFGTPTLWYLPEVLVYWEELTADGPGFISLSMTIPPHGCELLDPTGKAGQLSRRARTKADAGACWNDVPLPLGYECAYHAVQAYKPSTPASARVPFRPKHHLVYMLGDKENAALERRMTIWLRHSSKLVVCVTAKRFSGRDVQMPLPLGVPVAMDPEEVLRLFEEKMLIESLPVC
jgi:hypothetical protein